MGAFQQLIGRRSWSFPATAQEEEWELPNYCAKLPSGWTGGGMEAFQLLPRNNNGSFPTIAFQKVSRKLPEGFQMCQYCSGSEKCHENTLGDPSAR